MSCKIFKGIINFNDKPIRVIKEEEEMKTSKEMQLRILDKMRENVEKDINMMTGIEYEVVGKWYEVRKSLSHVFSMNSMTYRVKPQTITINGVEIPKPLTREEFKVRSDNDTIVYYPKPHNHLYGSMFAVIHDFKEGDIFYAIPSIAIEASKLLFGIKD